MKSPIQCINDDDDFYSFLNSTDFENEEDEIDEEDEPMCSVCGGSGESYTPELSCMECGGSGVQKKQRKTFFMKDIDLG